jgi:hypothetical protein
MGMTNFQNFDSSFGQSTNFQVSGGEFDFNLYDQSAISQPYVQMPTAHRPHVEALPHHVSAPAVPRARRQSVNSLAASAISRPLSAYADSSYYTSSAAMSPTLSTVAQNYFSGQDPYSPDTSEFLDLTGYDCSGAPQRSCQAASDLNHRVDNSHAASSAFDGSDEDTSASSPSPPLGDYTTESAPRSHQLYHVLPSEDGYYHCPFTATENCGHEPKQLKCEYECVKKSLMFVSLTDIVHSKHIDSHLKPFKCRNKKCRDLQFSSTACLLRHEREAHEMHGHAESLCEYPPCSRSVPGNGFRRSYNCKDHMTRCHGWVDNGPVDNKKRRSIQSTGGKLTGISKTKTKTPSKKQQILKLRQEWFDRKAAMEALVQGLAAEGPLTDMRLAQIQADVHTLGAINEALAKLERRPGTSG